LASSLDNNVGLPPEADLPSLLERLRSALAPEYGVDREIAAGGMAHVFLARDVRLDRLVAVKVLKPELATAIGAERFLREARVHAQLKHPNVVPIHVADERDGLSFYVMDYIDGETLAQRLTRGALAPDEVRSLGRELLAALAAVHALGITHRDIKPGNVFLTPRVLLTDFGIARSKEDETLTQEGQILGTPHYMPWEQRVGDATPATDVCATAALLFEAATGRRWNFSALDQPADWSGVPRSLQRALVPALAFNPVDRPSASRLQAALAGRSLNRSTVFYGAAALALILIAIAFRRPRPLPPPPVDFAILPFTALGDTSTIGHEVAQYAARPLEWFPAWSIRPTPATFAWWESASPSDRLTRAASTLRARLVVDGDLVQRSSESSFHLTIRDSTGALVALSDVPGSPSDLITWGNAVADSIVRLTYHERLADYRRAAGGPSINAAAYREFFRGQDAFRQDNWVAAEAHLRRALEHDTTFSHAAWQLALLLVWRRDSSAIPVLQKLYATGQTDLPELQRLLTEAQLEPDPARRLPIFAEAVRRYPANGDGLLLYANELFTRGPLVGIPVDSGLRVFEVTAQHVAFATVFVHATLGHIRLGQRDAAENSLRRVPPTSDSADTEFRLRNQLLRFAFDERFRPWRARLDERWLAWRPSRDLLAGIRQYARFGNFFDIPRAQEMLGRTLTENSREGAFRATGYVAEGLAFMLTGRPNAGLARLDSGTALLQTEESRIQQAEWRLLLEPLGLGRPRSNQLAEARERLVGATDHGRARAAWSLGVEAIERGDSVEAERWARELGAFLATDPNARPLHQLLQALVIARAGRPDSAATLALRLLQYNPRGLGGDPFARALLHLKLGDWLAARGDAAGAERAWLWTEAWDVIGWPEREIQAGEVDVAVSAVARLRRGLLALSQGRAGAGCVHLKRVRELWAQAEPELDQARSALDSLARSCA